MSQLAISNFLNNGSNFSNKTYCNPLEILRNIRFYSFSVDPVIMT